MSPKQYHIKHILNVKYKILKNINETYFNFSIIYNNLYNYLSN